MILRTTLPITAGILGLLITGCTANKPFRTNYTPDANASDSVIESTPDYKLGFVEFDDQGCFWDYRQVKGVEQMIRTETGGGQTNHSQGILLVVFTHGWKNNAAPDNSNVGMFRNILKQLAAAESAQTNHAPRKVLGVYAGWRGLSGKWEPLKELSFYERKNTAHKVGGYGALTELLVNLETLQQESNQSLATNVPRSELIIVGHSFGAAAVYSAISQIIAERFIDTIKRGQVLKPLGDQVILLNPAFEAARNYNLNQMAISMREYPINQRPVLSIFTSKGDWATHYFFPLGRYFSTLFEKYKDTEQKKASREAIGWFQPFVTHDLLYKTNAEPITVSNTNSTWGSNLQSTNQLRAAIKNVQAQRRKWHRGEAATFEFQHTTLKPRKNFQPGDPFPIVSVDKEIMKDHDDIGNPVLIQFLSEYMLFCQADSQGN